MNKVAATLVAVLSIPLLTFGLLFLVSSGSANSGSRLLTALVLLAAGVIMLVWALRRLRRLAAISVESLKTGAVDMASRMGGELTVAQLQAEYDVPQRLAQRVMDELSSAGTVVAQNRGERVVYVFGGLQASVARKLCPYCGTELPVREALRKCPNCGAQLEITKT
jgi:hypothetical protein